MNNYEAKKQARINRYKARAAKAKNDASNSSRRAIEMLDCIPMGQPILVGHYSEKGHRALLKRSDNAMRKASIDYKKAKYYEQKARAAENNNAISSDDPEALRKLKEKLATLENNREYYKKINALARKAKTSKSDEKCVEKLEAVGLEKEDILRLLNACKFEPERLGLKYPGYVLTNLGAKIRQVKKRIEALEVSAQTPAISTDHEGFTIQECPEDNRIRIIFDDKPEPEIRQILKRRGFRWSPSNTAWQRHLNGAGRQAVEFVASDIERLNNDQ